MQQFVNAWRKFSEVINGAGQSQPDVQTTVNGALAAWSELYPQDSTDPEHLRYRFTDSIQQATVATGSGQADQHGGSQDPVSSAVALLRKVLDDDTAALRQRKMTGHPMKKTPLFNYNPGVARRAADPATGSGSTMQYMASVTASLRELNLIVISSSFCVIVLCPHCF